MPPLADLLPFTSEMNKSDFLKLCERVERLHDAVYRKANSGSVETQKFPDGSSTHVEVI